MDLLANAFPMLAKGLGVTVLLGVVSFALGSALGALIALARISSIRVLRAVAIGYVSVFRGTPLLIQIMVLYFGLPQLGVQLEPIPSAILALTLFSAAYLSENFRGGILGVDKGQWEAASSIGMPYWRTFRRIVFPQAIRIATPAVGSRFIALMKDTSLASVVTVVELTRVAESVGNASFRYMEAFLLAGLMYWLINTLLSLGQSVLEKRMGRAY
ncbi:MULTISPECIES: amino acid ABC transporter permease [Amycolatopsis]|uniref:Amino acid ABC transporter membrane protein (PAAT family) n=1 Tax=Amycolatopsis echigonensis TaxID=2576905 RepID=A0A2N3WLD2_9PSEU|nr:MULTISPECIES: amino acid ABC transporter permease [Amycolatopsis]MBB2500820.1 amino acid ABC transporter permease [Amycolatopsis echigonensis]MCG3751223.1 amino acid ABC transporter permease [Amycolatopsis sp. Poz14]PKV94687.1 amino acid ABC transporter membrane protein (PAAT family) [Amycolatopsis niigatensis]